MGNAQTAKQHLKTRPIKYRLVSKRKIKTACPFPSLPSHAFLALPHWVPNIQLCCIYPPNIFYANLAQRNKP